MTERFDDTNRLKSLEAGALEAAQLLAQSIFADRIAPAFETFTDKLSAFRFGEDAGAHTMARLAKSDPAYDNLYSDIG